MKLRGKRAAVTLLAGTLAVTGVFAWKAKNYLQDSWWMLRLGSEDAPTRVAAAQELAERNCLRAVPEIVRLVALDAREDVLWHIEPNPTAACGSDFRRYRTSTPLVLALWDMGEGALPTIERSARRLVAGGEKKMRRIFQELRNRDEPLDLLHDMQQIRNRLRSR
jgi:hypothetical protein